MSSYKKFAPSLPKDNDVRSDVHTIEPTKTSLNQKSPQRSAEEDACKHMRKAAPANVPLRRTLEWVESLPPPLRPHVLVSHFPRIANLIAAAWGDQKSLRVYIESLFTDNRGNRRGFPPDVLSELIALRRYHDTKEQNLPWDAVSKRD